MRVFVPDEVAGLRPWVDAGVLGSGEVHAAAVLARRLRVEGGALWPDERVVLAYALAVWAPQQGHACVDLDSVARVAADAVAVEAAREGTDLPPAPVRALPWPEPTAWRRALAQSRPVRVVDQIDTHPQLDDRPLVLYGSRLYTQRQWLDEGIVANALRQRATGPPRPMPPATAEVLDRLLPPAAHDAQRAATATALTSRLAVIVGGPGTGKTHTVACLLVGLLLGAGSGKPPRIGLAAPTGKAAARMTEALRAVADQTLEGGEINPAAADELTSLRAVTVHRLLGPRPDHRTRFEHDADSPLPYDLVVIDETSMLALPMMARLLEAVPADCGVVLVGDPDQLTSIEAGAVLGDVVRAGEAASSPLRGAVVRLTAQHRTGVSSPIGRLADAIRRGRAQDVLDTLRSGDPHERLTFIEVVDDPDRASGSWPPPPAVAAVRATVGDAFAAARRAALDGDRGTALDLAARARILCAHRRGPAGVAVWNRYVESWILGDAQPRRDYSGRAVLATRNDPRTGIVNGDAGMLVRVPQPDGTAGPLRAAFRRGDDIRDYAPAELDELDTAFAITIHKSQGSEYDTVVLIQPPSDSPLVTRELLYTAVTRTSRQLVVVGSEASIRRAVERPTSRVTGLEVALSEPDGG